MAPGEHDDLFGSDLDEPPFRMPLPPDDRIWRHPSELAEELGPVRERNRALWWRFRRTSVGR